MANSARRYPGAGPFSEAQAALFCGRDGDLKRLMQLLARQHQVLIYAKSGVGKSSLINAGLIPALAAENRRSIKVRFYPHCGDAIPPLERMLQALPAVPSQSYLQRFWPDEDGLWLRFKAQQAIQNEGILLVFDQFEELFTYPPEQVQALKRQLAELMYDNVPDRYFQSVPDDEEYDLLYTPIDLKLVAAIREDKLSCVHQISDALPDLRHHYFELKHLEHSQAEAAIVKPAQVPGDYASQIFNISVEAVQEVLNRLSKHGTQAIEPTLLQIVCQQLENDIIEKDHKVEIVVGDLPEFEDLLQRFYHRVMEKIPANVRSAARKFVENELIQDGARVPVADKKCLAFLEASALDFLTKEHLIRSEHNNTGGQSYELSHDILVGPISELRQAREALEAEAARTAEEQRLRSDLEQAQAARDRERRLLLRTRSALAGVVLALLVAGIATIAAFVERQEAIEKRMIAIYVAEKFFYAEHRADSLREVGERRLQDFEESERMWRKVMVDQWVSRAHAQRRNAELAIAIEYLNFAISLDSTRVDLLDSIAQWKKNR